MALAAAPALEITAPTDAPEWALLERQVLHAHTAACEAFFDRYFDQQGFLLCVARWGGDDGPDDAIENVNDWPHIHALGGSDRTLMAWIEPKTVLFETLFGLGANRRIECLAHHSLGLRLDL